MDDAQKKNLIIGGIVAAVVVAIGVGAFLIIRARGGAESVSVAPTGAGTNAAPAANAPVVNVPESDVPVVMPDPNTTGALKVQEGKQAPPRKFDLTMNRLLTDDEKAALNYPKDWTVRIRVVQPKGGGDPYPEYVVENQPTDTDGDGLSDDQERQLGTDPNKADTDGDGLSDGEEVNSWKTDPLKADTDGDGVNDGAEVQAKTDPLSPASR